ncbi:MAG: tripartite tricarboxylate transporter substrate binding protein [Candidatus Rokubacteria bacterium]|nr:tripartite tricarboxylate transporter substrate binding protein [Candidatus Rokubacteria bacterium]
MTRVLAGLALVALSLGAVAGGAVAQEAYPSRPISIVAPFPPGGVVDLTGRPLVAVLEKILKQPVVLANKPGAAGAVGRQQVAIAKPDGYTLLVDLVSISTIPPVDALFGRTPAYTLDQFIAVARLTNDLPLLVVNAQHPWKTVPELVAELKKKPGELTYASSGPYGASHVPMEWFLQLASLKMRHLPTTGGGPATTAVLGNHAQMWVSPTGISAPHIKSGKLRALATFSATRHPRFPELPTMKELGYDIEYYYWTGLFAPKATPPAALKVLGDAVARAVQDPEFKNVIDKAETEIAYQNAEEFTKFWKKDSDVLAKVIQKIGKIESK